VTPLETAAESFCLLTKITHLLDQGHQNGCDLHYRIKMINPPLGFEIQISIDPPSTPETPAVKPDEPIQIIT
jgi:hypothetical protein